MPGELRSDGARTPSMFPIPALRPGAHLPCSGDVPPATVNTPAGHSDREPEASSRTFLRPSCRGSRSGRVESAHPSSSTSIPTSMTRTSCIRSTVDCLYPSRSPMVHARGRAATEPSPLLMRLLPFWSMLRPSSGIVSELPLRKVIVNTPKGPKPNPTPLMPTLAIPWAARVGSHSP